MAEPRRFQLFLLLLVMIIVAVPHQCSSTRPISIQNHQLGKQMHWFIFLLLGVLEKDNNNVMILVPWFFYLYCLGNSKMLATLGIVCKCCDGESGKCRSTWDGSCSKLQCLPWKFHWWFVIAVTNSTWLIHIWFYKLG